MSLNARVSHVHSPTQARILLAPQTSLSKITTEKVDQPEETKQQKVKTSLCEAKTLVYRTKNPSVVTCNQKNRMTLQEKQKGDERV